MDVAGPKRMTIVGGGLGGALMACFCARAGHEIDVYEARPDPRRDGFLGGRSINLALSTRGIDALRRVGLADTVLRDAVPMRGRMIHALDGTLTFQPYSKNPDDAINSVSRGDLNITLLEAAAAHANVRLHFGHRCESVDLDRPAVCLRREPSGKAVETSPDLIIGADGAFSAVRSAMHRSDRFDYSQSYLEHGYKEVSIPAADGGGFAMEPNALHIWPRGGFMMIALPNRDGSFTCTLFWPFTGPHGFDRLRTDADIAAYFEAQFADAVGLMPTLAKDFRANPTSSLVTVRCAPWHWGDSVVLLGDAAHAIVPFYGQGMNAAFEDCTVLDECLARHADDRGLALAEFTRLRRANADAIADMALENFIEMRDKVGSRAFLMKKRLEKVLHRLLPRWFTPLYNMVTFSTIPYARARARAARQAAALRVAGAALGAGVLVAAALLWWWL